MTDRVESWVETYKKSMLTPVILDLVATHQPVSVANIATTVAASTGWHVTERGLYRTLKRLQDAGLLMSTDVDAPRTGAKRKKLSVTPLGAEFLSGVATNLIMLPSATHNGRYTGGIVASAEAGDSNPHVLGAEHPGGAQRGAHSDEDGH